MKKLLASLLFASSLCLTACGASESSGSVKSNLDRNGYSTNYYTAAQAKELYGKQLTFDGFELVDSVTASKGEGDNNDLILVFFFADSNQASSFVEAGDNIVVFNNTLRQLGKNLTGKMGAKNNAAFCGSETAYNIAF